MKNRETLQQFVYYFLLSQQNFIYENFRTGAVQQHVYAKDIASLNFPIVQLAEQQRIVAKLDAVFAKIKQVNFALAEQKDHYEKLKSALLSQELTSKTT